MPVFIFVVSRKTVIWESNNNNPASFCWRKSERKWNIAHRSRFVFIFSISNEAVPRESATSPICHICLHKYTIAVSFLFSQFRKNQFCEKMKQIKPLTITNFANIRQNKRSIDSEVCIVKLHVIIGLKIFLIS